MISGFGNGRAEMVQKEQVKNTASARVSKDLFLVVIKVSLSLDCSHNADRSSFCTAATTRPVTLSLVPRPFRTAHRECRLEKRHESARLPRVSAIVHDAARPK